MSPVEIPTSAVDAALSVESVGYAVNAYRTHHLCADWVAQAPFVAALEAAAPLIVAAELERLAEDSDVRRGVVTGRALVEADEDPEESARLRRVANLHLAYARRLRARAAELRGGTHA